MINMYIECGTNEEMLKTREMFHNALVGSPAYIDSEIAICTEHDTGFNLIVGYNNDNNISLVVENFELT